MAAPAESNAMGSDGQGEKESRNNLVESEESSCTQPQAHRSSVCEMTLPGAALETPVSLMLETTGSSALEANLVSRSPMPSASQTFNNLLDREVSVSKRTLSARVTPAEIHSDNAPPRQKSYTGLDIARIGSVGSGKVTSSMKRGDLSPHRQWINGIWYASQEVERRREQQASEMFEEKRKADSLKDISSLVDEVRKQGAKEEASSRGRKILNFMATVRHHHAVHLMDVCCSLFLIFVMDIYTISSNATVGDDIMQGLALVFLCVLTLLFLIECLFNHDRSAPPYLVLEFFSLLSFIPAVVWWLVAKRITSIDDLWQVKIFIGCARAGKIIRLAVTFPRIYLWRLDLRAKTEQALFAAHSVKSAEKQLMQAESRASFDSTESRNESGSSKQQRSHISLIMNRQMVHHSVLFVCLFYSMLAGYEVQKFENNMRDVDSFMKILLRAHVRGGARSDGLFEEISKQALERLDQQGLKTVYLEVQGAYIFGDDKAIDSLRTSPPCAVEYVLPDDEGLGRSEIHLDLTQFVRADTGSTLYLSFMSLLVIFGTTAMMHKTLRTDVIRPMERMIAVIAQLAQEPLSPVRKTVELNELSTTFETKMVEMAIYKFASLLQLAFGEAGAGIIRDNSNGGVLHSNMTGKVVQGIFGFCDVRNFTTLTEILQGDVVKIVNGIADIVHAAVVDNFGAPNKNIGDAFLLVWKPKGEQKVSHVAEAALRSYVRTILQMRHSELLSGFAADEDVRRELHRRMPGLRLRLGFGLHYGWAVECAIGSNKKIDASYLSPHVNLASRLEAATKQFGVDLLISAHVHQLFRPDIQCLCRIIDCVTFKGSDQPIPIYTYDVPEQETVDKVPATLLGRGASNRHVDRMKEWEETETHLHDFFKAYPPAIDDKFRSLFSQGIMFYLGGADGEAADWERARELFKQCLEYRPHDGPSATLLAFIDSKFGKEGSPGQGWRGFRNLDEK